MAPEPTRKLNADRIQYNGMTYYVGVMPGKELLNLSFVSRRETSPKEGFQRSLDPRRAKKIADYLDSGGMSIPTNVVLSAQRSAEPKWNGRSRSLSFSPVERSFLVLDGQHRLFSMEYAEKEYEFSVSIYSGLSRREEVRLFMDINTTQVGVPTALILDIKNLAGTESDAEETLRALFDFVSSSASSPLHGLMLPSSAKRGYLSRVAFNNAMKKVVESNILDDLYAGDLERQGKLILNYLSACDSVLKEARSSRHKLTSATTLSSFMELFPDVVTTTANRARSLTADELRKTIKPWSRVQFDEYVGTNNATKARLTGLLRAHLSSLADLEDIPL